jgi:hypothetical protein
VSQRAQATSRRRRIVLFVDQLEERYTQGAAPEAQARRDRQRCLERTRP